MQTTLIVILLSLLALPVCAQDRTAEPLRVGTRISEPFVVRAGDGSLEGLSIELWASVADRLGIASEFVETDLDGMIAGVGSGEFDAAISAISVTPEREREIDFSHAFYTSGLGIAVRAGSRQGGFLRGLIALMTPGFWVAVGSLALLLLVVGIIAWIAERKTNPDEFGGGVIQGIGNGFWFSAVTMTTVGYGDKSPRSAFGRLVALVWMFASIIVISAFTGTIASSITSASLAGEINGPSDLEHARIGTLTYSATADALIGRGVSARGYDNVSDGLAAVASGEIDAFVHDAPILNHAIGEAHAGRLVLLDARFNLSPYAIALPEDSPLTEDVNRAVLQTISTPEWREAVKRWVGE